MDHDTVLELVKINTSGTDKEHSENNDVVDNNKYSPFRRQAVITLGVFLFNLSAGATTGISAIMIPQLKQSNHISTATESWIASISSLALVFGNLISGYLMERFGRRLSQIMLAVCFLSGWLIIGISNGIISLILIGRFITGLCQGWLGPLGPIFVAEISSPVHRGLFLAVLSFGIAMGMFLSHLFGTFLYWGAASLLCGLFPLTAGIIIYYAPESPAWLASRNRIDESIMVFQWYRGTSLEMNIELDKMIMDLKNKNKSLSKMQALAANIRKPEFYKPLVIMIVFFITCQLSAVNVISAYTIDMVEILMKSEQSPTWYLYAAMLSIDVLRCVSLAVACALLRTSGRRPMALFSGIFTSLCLVGLALYLYLISIGRVTELSKFITLGLIALYIIVSNMGVFLLPWNMVGELFAVETKGLGSGISVMMTSIACFAVVKSAPSMFETIGHHGAYLFFGLSTFCGTVFLYFYLPETRGKTLLQIEEHFRYGKNIDTKEISDSRRISASTSE